MDFIGLIPAGGKATRLGKLPFSKEVYPIDPSVGNTMKKPRVISEYLLNCFRTAGIENIYFIIRKGKWDIPDYFGDGADHELNIGYLIMNLPYGVPFTLNQAYPFIRENYIALGFPDIIFQPENAFSALKSKIIETNADIVLGIFPIERFQYWDMVEFDDQKRICDIIIKQNRPDLKYGWTIAMWNPVFSEFMHEQTRLILKQYNSGKDFKEVSVGDIIASAIKQKLKVDYVLFENGTSTDLGTPEELINKLKKIYFS